MRKERGDTDPAWQVPTSALRLSLASPLLPPTHAHARLSSPSPRPSPEAVARCYADPRRVAQDELLFDVALTYFVQVGAPRAACCTTSERPSRPLRDMAQMTERTRQLRGCDCSGLQSIGYVLVPLALRCCSSTSTSSSATPRRWHAQPA